MQPIQVIQTVNCQQSNVYDLQTKEQERKEQRRIQALEQIWEFMSQTYGNLWVDAFGEVAGENQAWKIGLTGLTAKQVLQGLEKTATSGKTFPPTLPEFLAYCRGSKYEFNRIYETCIYWSNDDELKRRGLSKTRETLFIMRLIGSDLREARNGQAEKIVQRGIDALEKHLENGGELPEFLVEIDEFPRSERKGFSLASFKELMAEG